MSKNDSSPGSKRLNTIFFSVVVLSLVFVVDISFENTKKNIPEEKSFVLSTTKTPEDDFTETVIYENNTVVALSNPTYHKPQTLALAENVIIEKRWVEITGYSSTVDQTNSEPFITASGEWVRDGIVATNYFPFGTKIRIPEYFGNKIFVVKDRMNKRYSPEKQSEEVWHDGYVDIWFPSRQEARDIGRNITYIEIIR